MVYKNKHIYVGEVKNYSVWIETFKYFQKRYPYRNILTGHGYPTNNSIYQTNIQYLEFIVYVANTKKNKADYMALLEETYPTKTNGKYFTLSENTYDNTVIAACPWNYPNCPMGIFLP